MLALGASLVSYERGYRRQTTVPDGTFGLILALRRGIVAPYRQDVIGASFVKRHDSALFLDPCRSPTLPGR